MARHAEQTVGDVLAKLWQQACRYDGIDPTSRFAVFSDENPYARLHSSAVQQAFDRAAEWRAGGYVGLAIRGGRAVGTVCCRMG